MTFFKMNIIPALWRKELLFFLCLIIFSFDGMISNTILIPSRTKFTSIADQITTEQSNDSTIYSTGISTEYAISLFSSFNFKLRLHKHVCHKIF